MINIKALSNSVVNTVKGIKDGVKQGIGSVTDVVTKPIKDIKHIKQKNKEIKTLIEDTDAKINPIREQTNKKLEELGKMKVNIISTTLEEFTLHMTKIENIPFHNSEVDSSKNNVFNFSQKKLDDLQVSVVSTKELLKNSSIASTGGALSAGAIYATIAALGTASTGAGIAGLSGIAASNATLAWLGGGVLAVGGGGIALGTIVLGGLAIIPTVSYMAYKGKFNYKNEVEEVDSAYKEATQYANNADKVIQKFEELSKFIDNSIIIIQKYNTECIKLNKQTDHIRHYAGDNYNGYTNEQQLLIQKHIQYLEGLLRILNTPIINEDGSIHKDIVLTIKYSNDFLNNAGEIVFVNFNKKKSIWTYIIPVVVVISIASYLYYQ